MLECILAGLRSGHTLMLAILFLTGTLATFVALWVEQRATTNGNSHTRRMLRSQLAKGIISIEEYNYLKSIL